ncbi:MAG: hypothetical protein K0S37_1907 [Microbacterium sp.]|nr:hypothetical protein [Microbacterium sp.]
MSSANIGPSGAGDAVVRLEGVGKSFRSRAGSTTALEGVDLEVVRGRIFGVIGHSGAGKSTLIRLLNGLERPTEGRVLLDGVDLASLDTKGLRAAQKRTGMIFQQFQLLETITVLDNVAMPLRLDGVSRAEARSRAAEALDFVGLSEKSGNHPGELSGGQKQRVGIARAIVRNPPVLLCDEATSALDPSTTAQIIALLRRINREYRTTIVLVTHEMDVIKDLCDEVAVMAGGRVVERGDVLDVFVRPQSEVAASFVSTIIPVDIPAAVRAQLGTGEVWRLSLVDDEVTQPLISTLIARIGVEVNILHADMTQIQEHTVGQLVIQIDGPAERVAAARAYLAEHVVDVREVERA